MIPEKIHYCWFGRGEKPKLAAKCIASWKKFCPEYEITEWNEDNFDVSSYPLLESNAFFGFENNENIATGLGFGAEEKHPAVSAMLDEYLSLAPDTNGEYPLIVCPQLNTKALTPFGLEKSGKLQTVCGALILPPEYLNPYDDPTGRLRKTKNTYSVHWYSKSWMSRGTVLRSKLTKPFHRIFGKDCFKRIR